MRPATRSTILRALAVALAVAALLWTLTESLARRSERAEIEDLMQSSALAELAPEAAERIRREVDPVHAKLQLARSLLELGIGPDGAAQSLPQRREQLELARTLADEVAARRPSLWQAPMLQGEATYLIWSLAGDPRVLNERDSWRDPLERAIEMAPGKIQPQRFLAAALLELWPALSPAERDEGREVLRRCFADEAGFNALVDGWLTLNPERDAAFALIPERSSAWRAVERHYAAQSDWVGVGEARRRRNQSLEHEITELRAEIAAALDGGDPGGARRAAQRLIALSPRDLRWRDAVAEALLRCPPGIPSSSWIQRSYAEWLEWGLAGFIRDVELLEPQAIDRLRRGAGELNPATDTLALWAAGNTSRARTVERRRDDLNTEAWGGYCLARARSEAELDDFAAADSWLRLMHPGMNALPEAQRVRLLVERRGAPPAGPWWLDAPFVGAVSWPGTDWRWRGREATLDFVAASTAAGLAVEFDLVPSAGAVAELALDFESRWIGELEPQQPLELELALEPGAHMLQVTAVAGGRVVPGTVRLIGASS